MISLQRHTARSWPTLMWRRMGECLVHQWRAAASSSVRQWQAAAGSWARQWRARGGWLVGAAREGGGEAGGRRDLEDDAERDHPAGPDNPRRGSRRWHWRCRSDGLDLKIGDPICFFLRKTSGPKKGHIHDISRTTIHDGFNGVYEKLLGPTKPSSSIHDGFRDGIRSSVIKGLLSSDPIAAY